MATVLIPVLSALVGVIGLLLILRAIFSRLRRRLEEKVRGLFDPKEIIAASVRANSFGERSKGGMQVRGNGALVLTREKLWFFRALPEAEFTIPLDAVTAVSLPKSFNHKTVFYPLLCVGYRTDHGEDAMAWAVKNPMHWKSAIERLITGPE